MFMAGTDASSCSVCVGNGAHLPALVVLLLWGVTHEGGIGPRVGRQMEIDHDLQAKKVSYDNCKCS